MSVELKPCPNCGCDVTLEDRGNLLVFLCPPHSSCIGSGLGTYAMASKRDTAIEQYNRRVIYFEGFESGANAAAEVE